MLADVELTSLLIHPLSSSMFPFHLALELRDSCCRAGLVAADGVRPSTWRDVWVAAFIGAPDRL
jgi:hypothetical protein